MKSVFGSSECFRLAAILIFIGLAENNHAFMGTSSLLAWSNAPRASLQEFSAEALSQSDVFYNQLDQLPLQSTSQLLCPSGESSLLIFTLSSSAQQAELKHGFPSSQINQEFNATPESARYWSNHLPRIFADRWISELPSTWTSLCQGSVISRELASGDNINEIFREAIEKIAGPRLIIFASTMTESDTHPKAGSVYEKRQLPESIVENSTLDLSKSPNSKAGVFWRYSFVSDYLIIGTLVMVLLFIPPVVLGLFALQSIETPKGLKTKMVGQVSETKAT